MDLHLSIENLDIDVLSLGFIISSLGLGVVSKLGVLACCWDVEINITAQLLLLFPSPLVDRQNSAVQNSADKMAPTKTHRLNCADITAQLY